MGVQDIIALTVAVGAVAYVGRLLWRTMNGRGGCGCSQSRKRTKPGTASSTDPTGLTRQPLLTIDQMGKPYPTRTNRSSSKS